MEFKVANKTIIVSVDEHLATVWIVRDDSKYGYLIGVHEEGIYIDRTGDDPQETFDVYDDDPALACDTCGKVDCKAESEFTCTGTKDEDEDEDDEDEDDDAPTIDAGVYDVYTSLDSDPVFEVRIEENFTDKEIIKAVLGPDINHNDDIVVIRRRDWIRIVKNNELITLELKEE